MKGEEFDSNPTVEDASIVVVFTVVFGGSFVVDLFVVVLFWVDVALVASTGFKVDVEALIARLRNNILIMDFLLSSEILEMSLAQQPGPPLQKRIRNSLGRYMLIPLFRWTV